MSLSRAWTLLRVALWVAIGAFAVSGLANGLEPALHLSDDLRWGTFYVGAGALTLGVVGSVAAKIVAAVRKETSRVPVGLLVTALVVGFLISAYEVLDHMGRMGVV